MPSVPPSSGGRRRSRAWIPLASLVKRRLAAAFLGIVAAIAAAEGALRAARISHPVFRRPDAVLGWSNIPGSLGEWHQEGHSVVSINADGLRDGDHARAKEEGVLRIAVIGDSYAEAFQVNEDEAFWAVMETGLRARGVNKGRVEVINFGVSAFGTAQELLMLRHKALAYDPDVVLLAVTTGNDLRNNLRALDRNHLRPYFDLQEDGSLVLDDAFRTDPEFRDWMRPVRRWERAVFNRSRFLQILRHLRAAPDREAAEAIRQADRAAGIRSVVYAGRPPGIDDWIYVPPVVPVMERAWNVTEALIAEIQRECEAAGARFVLVVLTNPIQVHPDPAVRHAFRATAGLSDLFYPGKRLAELGRRTGFPVLDLAPDLQRYVERNQVFLHGFPDRLLGDGHWNIEGHNSGGQAIAAWLGGLLE